MKLARAPAGGGIFTSMRRVLLVLGLIAALAVPVHAGGKKDKRTMRTCFRALTKLGVKFTAADRRGIDMGVRVRSPLGGVTFKHFDDKPLIIDCSLAVSLAAVGRWLLEHGIDTAHYSDAYHVRNIRGTGKRSNHSYGLAIDIHSFTGDQLSLTIRDDYEQGLGDSVDCIGQPLTQAGAVLRTLDCQLRRSGLFRFVLDPDYDANHYNHFHLEVVPWRERTDDPLAATVASAGAPPTMAR